MRALAHDAQILILFYRLTVVSEHKNISFIDIKQRIKVAV